MANPAESQAEPETVERKEGLGNALIYLTTIVLIISFVVMEKALASRFNAGMFKDDAKPLGGGPQ